MKTVLSVKRGLNDNSVLRYSGLGKKKKGVLRYSGPNENSVTSYRSLNTAYRDAWV